MLYRLLALMALSSSFLFLSHCSMRGERFLSEGSDPISKSEKTAYTRALHRCVKTGGTRIVKIHGNLRCF